MPTDKRPLKVFLCHASADKPKVRELYRYLKRRGVQPWLDAEDLLPGQNWQVEIPKALETSDAIIICLSKGSIDKEGYVQKEIRFALDRALNMPEGRIFLIPARLEECDLPHSLSTYQWVDLFDEAGHDKLMKSLKTRAGQLQRSNIQLPPAEPTAESALMQKQVAEHARVPDGFAQQKADVISAPFPKIKDEKSLEAIPAVLEPKTEPKRKKPLAFAITPEGKKKLTKWVGGIILFAAGIMVVWSISRFSRGNDADPASTLATSTLKIAVSTETPTSMTPDVTGAASTCDSAEFVSDVTVPDGTLMLPSQSFTKTWRLKNIGTCTWTNEYAIIFESGSSMNGPASQTFSADVPPGQSVDISVTFQAPVSPGEYKGIWKLRSANGVIFGVTQNKDGIFWVDIVVSESLTPTSSPTEITDGKGVPMVLVPEGEFTMGSENGQEDEKPAHRVNLDSYYIDKYEVTNILYKSCVDSGSCTQPKQINSHSRSSYYGNSTYDNYPVIYVDWNQASAFCSWRGAYLPSESQWEKAARGTDTRTYPWGEDIDCGKANFRDCIGDTTEVGRYDNGKSLYGVYELVGNVSEWTADWYDAFSDNATENPEYGTKYRVVRGGSWSSPYWFGVNALSVSYRQNVTQDQVENDIGFRCVMDIAVLTIDSGFKMITIDKVAYRGGTASAQIQTQPGTDCALGFILPSGGLSQAGGTGPRTADANGYCTWTWDIANNLNTGWGSVYIEAGGDSETYSIEIK